MADSMEYDVIRKYDPHFGYRKIRKWGETKEEYRNRIVQMKPDDAEHQRWCHEHAEKVFSKNHRLGQVA